MSATPAAFVSSDARPGLLLRSALETDLPAITAIYAHAVQHGTGTFEIDPPSESEMGNRWRDVRSKGWPWLVAERGATVLGYAYANQFRPRPAFRHCVEDSIYLHPDAQGQGVGRLLLAELMVRCEQAGARQIVAVIGDSANHASIGLHQRLGFEHTGLLRSAGWKFERWLDVVLMQRSLACGDSQAPSAL